MTVNNDLFRQPPLGFEIPNDGVTKVDRPGKDPRKWEVLEFELKSFVCEGEYEHGLQRILGAYLKNRSLGSQQAVWVSGFYGTGKSQMVRILEHLWANTELPNGATARGLVKDLPTDIADALRELDIFAKKEGAPAWSAAGDVDLNSTFNASVLSIALDGAGLPRFLAPAKVALWLAKEGKLDAVRAGIETSGEDVGEALAYYNVSNVLAEAILAAGLFPHSTADQVMDRLGNQFPAEQNSATVDETVEMISDILTFVGEGSIPPTLIILDEVQEFISGDDARAGEVRNLTQRVSTSFGGKVMLVATGQQEMTANPSLDKIKDRFTVTANLRNNDVDAVVRNVLLRKDPTRTPELKAALDGASGAVSKQLVGTVIAHQQSDDAFLVEDFPVLPSRRRFWEAVLRQAGSGRAGQLRSQLRIVHRANQSVAGRPVGTVVGADFLYTSENDKLNAAALLLKDTQKVIADQAIIDPLRGRVLGLIHLISMLKTSGPEDTGVRATAPHIADLLAEDLTIDGDLLRQTVPATLKALADDGVVQQLGEEYRLQTTAGREWEQAYRKSLSLVSEPDIVGERHRLFERAVDDEMPKRILQGNAKVSRQVILSTSEVEPATGDHIPVWLRSEWEGVTAKQVDDDARQLGSDSSVVMIHLPVRDRDGFRSSLASLLAAVETLGQRGNPQNPEGKLARTALESRRDVAKADVDRHVREGLSAARVVLPGGAISTGGALGDRIEEAALAAATRRYPEFKAADYKTWNGVIAAVEKGSATDALKHVGFSGDAPEKHPVVKTVLSKIKATPTPATKVEDVLRAPYGWPREALLAALGILIDTSQVQATVNSNPAQATQVMKLGTKLGQLSLRLESSPVSKSQELQARSILKGLGTDVRPGDDVAAAINTVVATLRQRAIAVSGPAPQPTVDLPGAVAALTQVPGNDRIHGLLAADAEARAFAKRLTDLEARLAPRLQSLRTAQELAAAAAGLDAAQTSRDQLRAVEESRDLLADTDPVAPILEDLVATIRDAVNDAYSSLEARRTEVVSALDVNPAWAALDADAKAAALRRYRLAGEGRPDLSTAVAVRAAVRARPLATWEDARLALQARADQVNASVTPAEPQPEPTTVTPGEATAAPEPDDVPQPSAGRATLHTKAEVDAYVEQLRATLMAALTATGSVEVGS